MYKLTCIQARVLGSTVFSPLSVQSQNYYPNPSLICTLKVSSQSAPLQFSFHPAARINFLKHKSMSLQTAPDAQTPLLCLT